MSRTTPLAVVRELTGLAAELRDTTAAYRRAEHDAATKRHHANVSEAQAFLDSDGAMEFRKMRARALCDIPEGEALVAEALVRVLKAELRSLEQQISVGQTTARVEGNPVLDGGL